MPLSVQMHHVFCNISDDVSVFAVAHRYREASITQLLYKPAIGLIKERAAQRAAAALGGGAAGLGGGGGGGGGGGAGGVGGADGGGGGDPSEPRRRISELRHLSRDVALQSVRAPGRCRRPLSLWVMHPVSHRLSPSLRVSHSGVPPPPCRCACLARSASVTPTAASSPYTSSTRC